jgi:hypothetical protein
LSSYFKISTFELYYREGEWLQRCTMIYEAKTTCFIQDHAQTGKQNKEPKCYSLGSYKQICLARKRH